jgi:hypothetical protein
LKSVLCDLGLAQVLDDALKKEDAKMLAELVSAGEPEDKDELDF